MITPLDVGRLSTSLEIDAWSPFIEEPTTLT